MQYFEIFGNSNSYLLAPRNDRPKLGQQSIIIEEKQGSTASEVTQSKSARCMMAHNETPLADAHKHQDQKASCSGGLEVAEVARPNTSSLLGLPPELRNQIHELTLPEGAFLSFDELRIY